jgi:hypothetical protein
MAMECLNLDLGKFRDIHKGAARFYNGEWSLFEQNGFMSYLDGEIVFGANAGFLIYKHYCLET